MSLLLEQDGLGSASILSQGGLHAFFPSKIVQSQAENMSDSQSLHPLSPDARAASPRKKWSRCCGKCASRIFHNTYSIRRAPQARASDRDGNQTASYFRTEEQYFDTD